MPVRTSEGAVFVCMIPCVQAVNSTLERLRDFPSNRVYVEGVTQHVTQVLFLRSGIVVSSGTTTCSDVANCTLTCCVDKLQPSYCGSRAHLTRSQTHRSIVHGWCLIYQSRVPQLSCSCDPRSQKRCIGSFHAAGTQHFISVCDRDCCACCDAVALYGQSVTGLALLGEHPPYSIQSTLPQSHLQNSRDNNQLYFSFTWFALQDGAGRE